MVRLSRRSPRRDPGDGIATAWRRFAGIVIDVAAVQAATFVLAVLLFAAGIEWLIPTSPLEETTSVTLSAETDVTSDRTVTLRRHLLRHQTFGLWRHAELVESRTTGAGTATVVAVRRTRVDPETLTPTGAMTSSDLAFMLLPLVLLVFESPSDLAPSRRLLGLRRRATDGGRAPAARLWLRAAVKAAPFAPIALLIAWPGLDAALRPWGAALFVVPFAAFLVMLATRRRAALHDLAAGTVVVRASSRLSGAARRL